MKRLLSAVVPALLIGMAIVLVEPLADAAGRPYLVGTAAVAGCIAISACGVDLDLGVGHQFLLGQGAFFGLGAYAYATFVQDTGLPMGLAAVAAVVLAAAAGAVVGWVFAKLGELLFAVGTLAVGVIALNAMGRLTSVTGGTDGRVMGRTEVFGYQVGRGQERLVFVALALGGAVALTRAYTASARGKRLRAVGVDPVAAGALGIDVRLVKVEAMVIASALGALGGVVLACTNVIVAPGSFSLEVSILMVVAVVLGGQGSVVGPVVAVAVLHALPELVEGLAGSFDLMIGLLLVAGMTLGGGARRGWGSALASRLPGRRPAAGASPDVAGGGLPAGPEAL